MTFTYSVRTSNRTPYFTLTKINWLTLFKEIIAVYTENHRNLLFTITFEDERERASVLLEGSQATPARPSGRNNVNVKTLW
jgi:hypothetical protein